jgi:hypothetical protein
MDHLGVVRMVDSAVARTGADDDLLAADIPLAWIG